MTADQKDALANLFCRYSYADFIQSNYMEVLSIMRVNTPQDLTSIDGYSNFFKSVSDIAEEVSRIEKQNEQETQVKSAIKFLRQKYNDANEEMVAIAKKIIEARIFNTWSEDNQKRFKTLEKLLTEWGHFFISYTNSSTPVVNNMFKKLLNDELDPSDIRKNKNRVNLIAKVLYKYFKMNRLEVFYDKEDIDWSDDFKDKIFSYCSKSFAFVQFIETEIFQQSQYNNYCYREYDTYCQAINAFAQQNNLQTLKPSYFFIISNPANEKTYNFEPAGLLEPALKQWATLAKEKQFVTIHQGTRSPELRREVQKAAAKIVEIKEKLLADYLNSF